MTTHPLRRLALAAGLLLLAGTARANEYTRFETLVVDPADSATYCPTLGMLSSPPAWIPGDAVAIVVGPLEASGRDRLVAALLGEETAVLELATNAACEPIRSRDGTTPPPLVDRIAAAREALYLAMHPGLVVGIGYAEAGPAMLGATGLHAKVAMATAASVRAGEPVPAAQRADARWPRFCAVLAEAGAGPPADCVAALGRAPQYAAKR